MSEPRTFPLYPHQRKVLEDLKAAMPAPRAVPSDPAKLVHPDAKGKEAQRLQDDFARIFGGSK